MRSTKDWLTFHTTVQRKDHGVDLYQLMVNIHLFTFLLQGSYTCEQTVFPNALGYTSHRPLLWAMMGIIGHNIWRPKFSPEMCWKLYRYHTGNSNRCLLLLACSANRWKVCWRRWIATLCALHLHRILISGHTVSCLTHTLSSHCHSIGFPCLLYTSPSPRD